MLYRPSRYLLLAMVLFHLWGCADFGDPLLLEPEIQVLPEALDFSQVTLDSTQYRNVIILSIGEGLLQGTLTLDQAEQSFSLEQAQNFDLAAGDTLIVRIGFQPVSTEMHTGILRISSNAVISPELEVSLSGEGTELAVPALQVSHAQIDFGTLVEGAVGLEMLRLTSIGTDTLSVDSIEFSDTALSSDLQIPLLLPPGAARDMRIRLAAMHPGDFQGDIRIYSNDAASPWIIQVLAVIEEEVSYSAEVQPIWDAQCVGCHGVNGGLSLASYADLMAGTSHNGPVVEPGNGGNSLIIRKLQGTAGTRMPAGGPFLDDATILRIQTWIDQGAQDN